MNITVVIACIQQSEGLCTKIQNDRRILSQEQLLSSKYCGVELIFVQSPLPYVLVPLAGVEKHSHVIEEITRRKLSSAAAD
jgi:hypothetical protein